MPQPKMLRSLFGGFLLCQAVFLCWPAVSAAATSRACLQEGIGTCADVGDGEARLACLDAFLKGCETYCPDVATPCARHKLEKVPAQSWKDPRRLAGALAEACFMDVNCPPPRERHPAPSKVVMP